MKIGELKNKFQNEMESIYPREESDSFFYLLCEAYLKLRRIDITLEPNLELNPKILLKFTTAINKLKKETPIQYIIGMTEFYGLPFFVNENVLIPRPETEELVTWVLKERKEQIKNGNEDIINILDIGTGSGCIAITLAKKFKNSMVWAIDISKNALEIAKRNANLNGVIIKFLYEDILKLKKNPIKFDIIVSNPPYVRELEKQGMKNNVLNHEPHIALFVPDENPLLFYDKIASFAKNNLKKNGQVYLEINQYLAEDTEKLLKKFGFQYVEIKKDIFENDRMIHASLV